MIAILLMIVSGIVLGVGTFVVEHFQETKELAKEEFKQEQRNIWKRADGHEALHLANTAEV